MQADKLTEKNMGDEEKQKTIKCCLCAILLVSIQLHTPLDKTEHQGTKTNRNLVKVNTNFYSKLFIHTSPVATQKTLSPMK